jgi:diacylglycerol kinase family enzyme
MAYWLTAFSKLSELQESRVQLELDSETIDITTYGLAVANGKYVGGGFPVAPIARLDDGLLDVTAVPILPTIELLASGVDFILGRHHAADRVRTMRSSRVRVIAEPRLIYSFDGESIRGVDATFEIVPGAMRIV